MLCGRCLMIVFYLPCKLVWLLCICRPSMIFTYFDWLQGIPWSWCGELQCGAGSLWGAIRKDWNQMVWTARVCVFHKSSPCSWKSKKERCKYFYNIECLEWKRPGMIWFRNLCSDPRRFDFGNRQRFKQCFVGGLHRLNSSTSWDPWFEKILQKADDILRGDLPSARPTNEPVERCGSFLHPVQEATQWEVALQLSSSGLEW